MSDESAVRQPNSESKPASSQVKAGSPNDFLKSMYVHLTSRCDWEKGDCASQLWHRLPRYVERDTAHNAGTLSCLDGYMNIAMEDTSEHVDGVLKSTYGDAFIRGNNGTYNVSYISVVHHSCRCIVAGHVPVTV